MDWSDEGIVLSARPHGESGLIVSLLTRTHGRHAGFVPGGGSRRASPVWQPGNVVEVGWRARLSEQLGNYTGELREPHAARALDDAAELAGLSAACAVADAALPEREPHPAMFDGFRAFLGALGHPGWPAIYVRLELGLLQELGFGLDLDKCAVTGATEDLAYRLAEDRPGGVAGGGGSLQGEAAGAAGLSVHRRVAVRRRAIAPGPRFDGLFPRTARLLAAQQALACRAGEICGNASALK